MPTRPRRDDAWDRLVRFEPLVLLVFAALDLLTVLKAGLPSHVAWGHVAVLGTVAGATVSLVFRRRGFGYLVAFAGSTLAALLVLVVRDIAQPEVHVLVSGARSWVSTGSPYLTRPLAVYDYRPYLPALFGFGLPEAVLHSPLVEPRVVGWVLFLAALVAGSVLFARDISPRLLRAAGAHRRGSYRLAVALAAVGAFPPIAQSWTASFIDVPQTALTILALALCAASADGRWVTAKLVAAGALLGCTAAMKPIGLCAVFVVVLWAHAARGRRAALWCAGGAIAALLPLLLPVLVHGATGLWLNVERFPAGQAPILTPAGSPFPGALLWQSTGRHAAEGAAVLAIAGILFAAYCLRHPPTDVRSAARQLAIGWVVAFLAAPTGRFGYLWMPVVLWLYVEAMTAPGLRVPEWGAAGRPLRRVSRGSVRQLP